MRPLARAGQAAGAVRCGVRFQPSDAVVRLQQTIPFALGQAARPSAKPRRLGDDEIGKIISERQRTAIDEMNRHSTAVKPALG